MAIHIMFAFSIGVAVGIGFCWITFFLIMFEAHNQEMEEKRRDHVLSGQDPALLKYWYEDF